MKKGAVSSRAFFPDIWCCYPAIETAVLAVSASANSMTKASMPPRTITVHAVTPQQDFCTFSSMKTLVCGNTIRHMP